MHNFANKEMLVSHWDRNNLGMKQAVELKLSLGLCLTSIYALYRQKLIETFLTYKNC